jgi:long-subunit fatty acid transport protein
MKSLFSSVAGLLLLIFFISFSKTYAQNETDALRVTFPGLGVSARALGMGNSYIGLSDDASAAYFNPAGLGLLKKIEISGGLNYDKFNNNTTFFDQSSSTSNSTTRFNRISLAIPFPTYQGSLVFGVSYYTTTDLTGALKFNGFNPGNNSMIQNLLGSNSPQDYNIPYDLFLTDTNYFTPINGKLNQSGSILSSGSINNWAFTGAIEVYKNLFVGLDLNIIHGSYNSNSDYYEDDTQGIYSNIETNPGDNSTLGFQTFYLNRILDWNISGWDAKLGVLYQANDNTRVGITVQFPKYHTIKENFTVNGSSTFGSGVTYTLDPSYYSSNVKYDIVSPFELGGGLSVNLKGLILSGQATLIDYSQTEFRNPDGLSEQYIASINKDIKDLLRAVVNFNAGLEYTIPDMGLRLRGGFIYQPSPYQGDPSQYDRKYITAGIGFLANNSVGIDVGYAHGWWKDYGDNYGSDVSRTYQDLTKDRLTVDMTYRF